MKRISYLDYVRAYGCLSVIIIHVVCAVADLIDPSEWRARLLIGKVGIESLCRVAVPLFIMVSGSLLLQKERQIGYVKLKKYITRMLLVLATFGLGFCFIESVMNGDRGVSLVVNPMLNLLQGKSWAIMWYVYMLVGLYVLTPLLKKFADNAEKRDFEFTLGALFVTNSLLPTIGYIAGLELTQFYLLGLIYVFYYLLGQYLYRYRAKKTVSIVAGVIGLVGLVVLNLFPSYYESGLNLCSVPMVCFAFAMFSLAQDIKREPGKVVMLISKYSFGIYLIHTFWLNIFNKGLHIYPTDFMPGIGEIGFFVVTLVLSLVSSMILYRLPGFRKILK